MTKPVDRERSNDRSLFYSERYFSMRQLASFCHQLNIIQSLNPTRILEVGIGNGFVSTFLKCAGMDVHTVDINAALTPDVVSSIAELPDNFPPEEFDLVSCCEVLEHLPFEMFDLSIAILRKYSRTLFCTLPSYENWYGLGGFLDLPRYRSKVLRLGMSVRRNRGLAPEHYWELGYSSDTSRRRVIETFHRHYVHVAHGVFALNPYHEYFICRS